jgi:hypothetical protein
MEDGSFLIMVVHFIAVMLDDLNLIFPPSLIGTSVEKPCVFITLNGSSNLASLLPNSKFSLSDSRQNGSDQGS